YDIGNGAPIVVEFSKSLIVMHMPTKDNIRFYVSRFKGVFQKRNHCPTGTMVRVGRIRCVMKTYDQGLVRPVHICVLQFLDKPFALFITNGTLFRDIGI